MAWTRAAVVALCALPVAAPGRDLAAQRPAPVELHGRVIDDATLEPIAGAQVILLDPFGDQLDRRITDEHGQFLFQIRRATAVRLRSDRIGYQATTTPVLYFDGRLFYSVELRLDVEAVLLAPLEVVARSQVARSPVLASFDHRLRSGLGSYITRAEIEQIRPVHVTDLLIRLPGVRLKSAGRGTGRYVEMTRAEGYRAIVAGDGCPVQVFVDGRLMNARAAGVWEVGIDELVTPNDVEGIEVYRGLSSVPAEFLNDYARCGVVAVWTRRGG